MNKYKEKQRFNDVIVHFLLWTGVVATFGGLIMNIYRGTFSAVLPCLIVLIVLGATLWWLRQLELKVSVNDKRIKYRLSPIHGKSRRIDWDDVASCQVVKSPPLAKWHGSNIRFGGEGWFSLNGRNGMELTTKDGRQLFIGCQNVDDLARSLSKMDV